ncbi:MAG: hypothetical protein AAGJ84_05555 [Pseudomonadota bacterium]
MSAIPVDELHEMRWLSLHEVWAARSMAALTYADARDGEDTPCAMRVFLTVGVECQLLAG